MNKAFFLDRDGTLNIDFDYVHLREEWVWCDGALDALRWMKENQYKIIVITNQSGIARGRFTQEQVDDLHQWVDQQLEELDLSIDAWYVAPYHPDFHDGLDPDLLKYRKPNTGLFEKAKKEFDIDFNQSFMAGDKVSDLKPAVKLGIKSFFIRSRHEPFQDKKWIVRHKINTFNSLWDAIQSIELINEER